MLCSRSSINFSALAFISFASAWFSFTFFSYAIIAYSRANSISIFFLSTCSIFSISSFCSISLYHLINSLASLSPISIWASFSAASFSSMSMRCFSRFNAAALSLTTASFFVKSGAGFALIPENLCSFVSSFSLSSFSLS